MGKWWSWRSPPLPGLLVLVHWGPGARANSLRRGDAGVEAVEAEGLQRRRGNSGEDLLGEEFTEDEPECVNTVCSPDFLSLVGFCSTSLGSERYLRGVKAWAMVCGCDRFGWPR